MITEGEFHTLLEIGLKLAKTGNLHGAKIIEEATLLKNSGMVENGKSYRSVKKPEQMEISLEAAPEEADESEVEERAPKKGRKKPAKVTQRYSKILKAFPNAEYAPLASVQEIAELTGFPVPTVYRDLRDMKELGKVVLTDEKTEGPGKRPDLWAPASYKGQE